MVLTPESFELDCGCGKRHDVSIEKIIIEENTLAGLKQSIAGCGLGGRATAIYDENTKSAVSDYGLDFDSEVVLSPTGLHADENATKAVMARGVAQQSDFLVAVGSGTVHDITRWCANEIGIPFISCPTAASVDGFCSSVSAMTWYGYKKTMPGIAPALVVADLNVIAKAPFYLTSSGVGDMVGKYISLADWRMGNLLTGEDCCAPIVKLMSDALSSVTNSVSGLALGDFSAYEKLVFGLLLSGVAMQLSGNSRPASGAEHHISHFIEMGVLGPNTSLHGEKVGVGALLVASVYQRIAELTREDAAKRIMDPAGIDKNTIERVFGRLSTGVLEENKDHCLHGVTAEIILANWSQICETVREIPSVCDIERILLQAGAKTKLLDVGVSETRLQEILYYSPFVRNRLTLMRIASECGLLKSLYDS